MKRLSVVGFAISTCLVGSLLGASGAVASGSIKGTATAAGSGTPIAGLSVCAEEDSASGVASGCTATDAEGRYRIDGLPAGANYQVEFSALGDLNYLTQYFKGKEGLGNWDRVTVADGSTTEGVDAVMNPGAQIGGRLTEQGTGAPAIGAEVCILDPAPNPRAEEFERCAQSDSKGSYTVRSLPAGTYIVDFAPHLPLGREGVFEEQYYRATTVRASATPISLAPPETVSGIDAILVNTLQTSFLRVPALNTVTRRSWARVGFRFSVRAPVHGFLCKRDG